MNVIFRTVSDFSARTIPLGNLCWESAMEEDLWSKLMIAPLYNNALDGDVQMRQQWLTITNRYGQHNK